MQEQFVRTGLLFGPEAMNRLQNARVAVFGLGGVGGHVVDALARSGVGTLDLIDKDDYTMSNLNRQIYATLDTVGKSKVEVAAAKVLEINPHIIVNRHHTFYLPENRHQFDFTEYDYVVDAIDTVAGKLSIIEQSKEAGVRVISSMGAGNKINPAMLEVADIYETSVCPLARVMRKELKKRNITGCKVVYSKEKAMTPIIDEEMKQILCKENGGKDPSAQRKQIPGSNAFVPAVAGLIIASEVIKDLTEVRNDFLA